MQELKPIGDVNSNEPGSAARYNAGKPAMELIPLILIGEHLKFQNHPLATAMICLGRFQVGGNAVDLHDAIAAVDAPWHECAQGLDYGRKKYATWNWSKGMPWSVPLACAARHLLKMIAGEADDQESGVSHRGLVTCNIIMLLTYLHNHPEGDDRPTEWLAALSDSPSAARPIAFDALRKANIARDAEWGKGQDFGLSYRGNELAGETGEACNILKKLDRERRGLVGSRATVEKLAEELADVIICADLAAMDLNIDLAAAVASKFNKTSEKYGLATRLAQA